VIHLLRGELAEAWKTHPKCLQEPEDIAQVKEWIEEFVARQSEQAYAHLVMGLFLAQSGQAEQSIAAYKQSLNSRHSPPILIIFSHRFMSGPTILKWPSRNTVKLCDSILPMRRRGPTWAWLIKNRAG